MALAMILARLSFAAALNSLPMMCEALAQSEPGSAAWSVPNIDALPDDAKGQRTRLGRMLVTETYFLIGPQVADSSKRFAGNNLACANCHLEAGTKKFGLPIFGLAGDFPKYSARLGALISIEDRINSCMTRSMNGRVMPVDAPEMWALVAYLDFLSSDVAKGEQLNGHGSGDMPELDRAADPERGAKIYADNCLACHRSDGAGLPRDPQALGLGYVAPPLWGSDSFNDGAGMARIINMANFVHSNMPASANYLHPIVSTEDAWDVAAYVESQLRPQKKGLERDFPDLLDKPVDAPYGPYADGFGEAQHKYGPFAPIRAEIARLKAERDRAGGGTR
jgi:thiosulfate dehydrogenase